MVYEISDKEFEQFQQLIYHSSGIHLKMQKRSMIQGRLQKRLIALEIDTFSEYYRYILKYPKEKEFFLENVSTHVTEFFREKHQWKFLEEYLSHIPPGQLRIWSAGCSTGEEPYSIAMFLREELKNFKEWDIKILATDIAHGSLQKAMKGIYGPKSMEHLPDNYKKRYFEKHSDPKEGYRIRDEIREMVLFREFNLIYGDFSMFKNPFDIIFCRNVMIYFDAPTRHALVNRFSSVLKDEGVLLLGHSESIIGEFPELNFCGSAVYEKVSEVGQKIIKKPHEHKVANLEKPLSPDTIERELEPKNALIIEMEEMTKKLLEMNKKAEEAQGVQSKFMSLVKNELNNPLAVLLMLSKKLREKSENSEYEELGDMLYDELLRMNYQLANIFAVADIEVGENSSFYTMIKMEEVLKEVLEKLHYIIKEKQLKVNVQNSCSGAIPSDKKKVVLILINLLSNACQVSPNGGEVEVEIVCSDELLQLRVADEGIGVSEEDREKIFEPFFRIETPNIPKYHGLGLGLSVALALTQSENGTISFIPKEKGAIFEAKIPFGAVETSLETDSEEFIEL